MAQQRGRLQLCCSGLHAASPSPPLSSLRIQVGYTLPPFSSSSQAGPASAAGHRDDVESLRATVAAAVAEYGTAAYAARQQHCMGLDLSWAQPAEEWEALLRGAAAQR